MDPTFLVIGAAKCGTTTLCNLLSAHPDVFVTDPKEPHYYSRVKRRVRRDWYEGLYAGAKDARARGEGSTSYSHPNRINLVVPTLKKLVPECRFIYIVRHPVRRLESDWRMRRVEGRLSSAIGDALERNVTLVTLGLYWKNLSVYRRFFPDEQILVMFLEDLAADPEREIQRAYRHIGVDPDFIPRSPDRQSNTAADRRRGEAAAAVKRFVPGAKRIESILPDAVVEWGLTLLSGKSAREEAALWDRTSFEAVVEFFKPDAQCLLEYCGKPSDFWTWNFEPTAGRDAAPAG